MGLSWVLLAILSAGSGNDLVEFIATKDYWQAKKVDVSVDAMIGVLESAASQPDVPSLIEKLGAAAAKDRAEAYRQLAALGPVALPELKKAVESPDPEVAVQAKQLIAEAGTKSVGQAGRRLMAIRTLGELKDAKGLPTLKKVLASKAMFEAEYAERAIAAIEGKACPPSPFPDKLMKEDLYLLPANCALVGQVRLTASKPGFLDEIFKALAGSMPPDQIAQASGMLKAGIIEAIDKLGNVRACGATVGIADNIGDRNGFVVLVVRGQFDAAALRPAIMQITRSKAAVEGAGTDPIRLDGDAWMIVPSNERLALIVGPRQAVEATARTMAEAIKAGKGKLAENAELEKLINAADTSAMAWVAAKNSQAYAQLPILGAFKTGSGKAVSKAGQIELSAEVTGGNADEVKTAVQQISAFLDMGRKELGQEAGRMPALAPLLDFLNSVKVTADGVKATATGEFKGTLGNCTAIPFLMFLGVRSSMQAPPMAPVQPAD